MSRHFRVILYTQALSTELVTLKGEIFLVQWWGIHTSLSNKTSLGFYSVFHERTSAIYAYKCLHAADRKFGS